MKAAVVVGIPDVRGKVRHPAIVLCHEWGIGTVATPVECERMFSAVNTINQPGSPCLSLCDPPVDPRERFGEDLELLRADLSSEHVHRVPLATPVS